MESEQDTREVAQRVKVLLQSEENKKMLKTLMFARPDWPGVLAVVQQASLLVASILQEQKDKELYFTDGSLLRFTMPIQRGNFDEADETFREFASKMAPELPRFIPN